MKQNFKKAPLGRYDKTCSMLASEASDYLVVLRNPGPINLGINYRNAQGDYILRFNIPRADIFRITYTFKPCGLMVLNFSKTLAFKNEDK